MCVSVMLCLVATAQERYKAFKTCTANLSLVSIYFIPILITYTQMEKIHPNARIINLFPTSAFPPMLNPVIYVLQTQEIKASLKRLLRVTGKSRITIKLTMMWEFVHLLLWLFPTLFKLQQCSKCLCTS